MDILDSRVVVTGGASGIGKALAKAFIKEKSSYVLIAVSYTHLTLPTIVDV